MIVWCPKCGKPIPCEDDASCVEPVPPHGHNCPGAGQIGFVMPSTTEEAERDEECVRQAKRRNAA